MDGKILGVPYVVLEQIDSSFFRSRFGAGSDESGGMWKAPGRGPAFEPETAWARTALGAAALANLTQSQASPSPSNFSFDEDASNAVMAMEVTYQMDSIICSLVNNMYDRTTENFGVLNRVGQVFDISWGVEHRGVRFRASFRGDDDAALSWAL